MSVEWQFLIAVNEQLRPLKDPVEIQDVAVRMLGKHLRASRAHYALIDGDEFVVTRSYADGVPPLAGRGPLARFGTAIVEACRRGETVVVDDVASDARFTAAERDQLLAGQTAALVGTPLIKGGRWLGTFAVHSATPLKWARDQVALVEVTADRMWAAAQRAQAEEALGRSESRQAFLLRLNDALRPLSDAAAIQDVAARLLGQHLGAARVGYAEFEGAAPVVRREHTRGVDPLTGPPLQVSVGPTLRAALRRGETIVVNDIESDQRLGDDDRATFRARQIAAFVGQALFKDGRMVGAFGANHDQPREWTTAEVELIRDVAARSWDAVERTRAEAALREQTTRLGLALKASAGGSWTWDTSTNDADWDAAFRAQFGFTPEEPALFETWLSRVHVDDRERMRRRLDEVWKGLDTWDHTYRITRPDGALRWMHSLGRADRDATGRVTRMTGLELDITERRRADEALQARRDQEHDRTLHTLLETAAQGIVAADASGLIVFANRAFEVMFGWRVGELIGQPIERLIPSVVRDGTSPAAGLARFGTRRDESVFPIEVGVTHVPTPGGGRVFAFVTDITERRRAALALEERTTELEHRTTQLSQMAWDLTLAEHHAREQLAKTLHDGLQQILVIVALNLEQQLKRDSEAGAKRSELLVEALDQVDEALDVARSLTVELFPPVLQRSGLPTALTWLANWARDKYKLRVKVRDVAHADSARKDIRTLLFESVRELLFNVVKYAQTDQVTVTLAHDEHGRVCITVADQGVGFEPARLDDRSRGGQVGWGLFRIRERLTLLGGRMDIDSAPGKGTRVRLVAPRDTAQVPVGVTPEPYVPAEEAAPVVDDDRAAPDALRILIVDDHRAVRRAMRQMLHQRPQLSVVGEAANGVEAIARAQALQPDVILMDISMPQMDGVEATARIRAALPGIRVLGVSMLTRDETAAAIEQAGAAGFFVKGTDTERLIEHLLAFHTARATADRAES